MSVRLSLASGAVEPDLFWGLSRHKMEIGIRQIHLEARDFRESALAGALMSYGWGGQNLSGGRIELEAKIYRVKIRLNTGFYAKPKLGLILFYRLSLKFF